MSACGELRDRLMEGTHGSGGDHLETCSDCRTFAARLDAARRGLIDHHARVEPDTHFASRVAARLEDPEADPLAWAAWRLLPVGLALLVVLAALSLQPPTIVEPGPAPWENVLAWLADAETAPISKSKALIILTGVFLLGAIVGVLGTHVAALHAPQHLIEHAASVDHEQVFLEQLDRAVDLNPEQEEAIGLIVRQTHVEALALHEELSPRVHELLSAASGRIESVLEPEQVAPFRHFAHEHHRRAQHLLLGAGAGDTMR